jgi:hypothetical protein
MAHLLYATIPDLAFSYEIKNDRVYYTYPNGSGTYGVGSGYDAVVTYLTAPIRIYPILLAMIIQQSLEYVFYYLIFVLMIFGWSHNKPFERIRGIIWKLPLLYYPIFLVGWIIENSGKGLGLQIIVMPIFMITAYFYVVLAWGVTPERYKNAPPR